MSNRSQDSTNQKYHQTPRIIINDFGVFYKIRGGKLNGPFVTEVEAKKDLRIFMQVLKIERELDTSNLRILN